MNNFQLNTTYSILLKISSNNNLTFKMCGPQMGLVILDKHNLEHYTKLYELILTRIEFTIDKYEYMQEAEGLELMYSVITPNKELALKNINNLNNVI